MRSGTTLTADQLNRSTLARQLLLSREPLSTPDAVKRVVALQAQEPASPYLALWNRVKDFKAGDLDTAFRGTASADGTVVKASLMRVTLHAVHADDYPAFHNAMMPLLREPLLRHPRFTDSGLTASDAEELLGPLLEFAASVGRTKVDVEAMFEERLGFRHPGVWWAMRVYSPLVHVPTGATWSFGVKAAYRAFGAPMSPDERAGSVRTLVCRYLEGFGPASIADLARFTRLPRADFRDAVRSLVVEERAVVHKDLNGRDLYDVPDAPLPPAPPSALPPAPPRLLPMWDSTLLAYSDASRMIAPEFRPLVTRVNGDVLPTLLVDGRVAGVWRPTPGKGQGGIEATAFQPLKASVWKGLAKEAGSLVTFLADRDPEVYRRYNHWWAKPLPAAEVRVLG